MFLRKVCAGCLVISFLLGLVGCSEDTVVVPGETYMDWEMGSGLVASTDDSVDVMSYIPFDDSTEAGLHCAERIAVGLASAAGHAGLVSPGSVELNTRFAFLADIYSTLGYTVYPFKTQDVEVNHSVSDQVLLRVECDCDLATTTVVRSFGVYPTEFTAHTLSGTLVWLSVEELLVCSSVDDVLDLTAGSMLQIESEEEFSVDSDVSVWVSGLDTYEDILSVLSHVQALGLSGVFFVDTECETASGYYMSAKLYDALLGMSTPFEFPVCVTSKACEEAVWGSDFSYRGVRFEFEGSSDIGPGLSSVPSGVLLIPGDASDVVVFCDMATLSYDFGYSLLPASVVASGAACGAFSAPVVCLYSGGLKGVLGALFGDSGASGYLSDVLLVDISGFSPAEVFPVVSVYTDSGDMFSGFTGEVEYLPVMDCSFDLGSARGFVCCNSSGGAGFSQDRAGKVTGSLAWYERLVSLLGSV